MRKRDLSYVDVVDFLTALGTRNVNKSGNEVDFSCPSPNHVNGDQSPSARMNVHTTLWVCHGGSCGLRGDAVTFLTLFHDLDESEAQRVIDERYGGPELSVEAGGLRAQVERIYAGFDQEELERVPPQQRWVDEFTVDWTSETLPIWSVEGGPTPFSYMLDRGFSKEILNSWGVGYDNVSNRITIPVFDRHGVLVGFKGRAWKADHHPKYLIIGDAHGRQTRYGFDTYSKSKIVFGLHRVQSTRAVICEGELNAIALHEAGELGAVAVAGAEFSSDQAAQIIGNFSSAVTYFDGNDAGKTGTLKVVDALEPYMPVSIVLDAKEDAAELGPAALPVIAGAVSSVLSLKLV